MAQTIITSTTENPKLRIAKSWSSIADPSTNVLVFEDWLSATPDTSNTRVGNNFWQISSSGGTVGPGVGEGNALGVLQLGITNGRSAVYMDLDGILLNGPLVTIQTRIKIPTIATVAQAFRVVIGLGDSSGASVSTDGVFFQHDETTGNWMCKTRSNNSETSTTTTTAVSAGSWVTLKFVISANASKAEFYIGSTSANMTLVATHTTNIPSGTGREAGPLIKLVKTAGNTSRTMLCDYYQIAASIEGGR